MIDNEELQRERDANIQGVPEKDQTWVYPRYKTACVKCFSKRNPACCTCKNFGICTDGDRYSGCWVGKECENCEEK